MRYLDGIDPAGVILALLLLIIALAFVVGARGLRKLEAKVNKRLQTIDKRLGALDKRTSTLEQRVSNAMSVVEENSITLQELQHWNTVSTHSSPPAPPRAHHSRHGELAWPSIAAERSSPAAIFEQSALHRDSVAAQDQDDTAITRASDSEATDIAEPVFSVDVVRTLYSRWQQTSRRPHGISSVAIAPVEYLRAEAEAGIGTKVRHVLRTASQLSEFVLFSEPGSDRGLVLPDLDAHYSPVLAHLFPGLTRDDLQRRESLLSLTPVDVARRGTTSDWVQV